MTEVAALGALRFSGRLLGLFSKILLALLRPDEALFLVADEIRPLRFLQRLDDERPQLPAPPLQQRPLQRLVVGAAGHIYGRHVAGVDAGVVHAGGDGAGGGVKVLHLLGLVACPVQELRQTHGVRQRAARVGGHEVGHEVLLLVVGLVELLISAPELFKDAKMRLTHVVQHRGHAVLRRHLQLAADVVLHQLAEKVLILVLQHVVIADAAADEHFFHLRELAQPPQKLRVLRVVGVQIFARLGGKAAAIFAAAVLFLPGAGCVAEVGRGAAHVVDIALELRVFREDLRLPHHRLDAAGRDHPPLMKGQGAEVAPAEAAPIVGDGEPHLLDGRHRLFVHGVHLPHEGQVVEPVQLLSGQGALGRVGDEIAPLTGLHHAAATDGVVFVILQLCGLGVGFLVLPHALVGGRGHGAIDAFCRIRSDERRAPHIGDVPHRDFLGEPAGDLFRGRFSHAVHQQIRRRVKEDGAAHLVVPVVIVGKAAQRRLQPADDDGHAAAEGLPRPIGVHDGRPIGTQPHFSGGGIEILLPPTLGHSVVRHHAVQISAADEHAEAGLAHSSEGGTVVPVRLRQHRHPIALRLQQTGDEGGAEAGVVDVGVRRHHQKVVIVPVPRQHLLSAHGQKFRSPHASSP